MRHYSDDVLLTYLDGEVPFWRKRFIRRHIERCWDCRTHLAEIENSIEIFMRALSGDSPLGPDRVVEAKLSFLAQANAVIADMCGRERSRRFGLRASHWLAPAALATAIAVLLIGWHVVVPSRPDVQPPAAIIAAVASAEASAATPVVAQEFHLVVDQVRPQAVRHEKRLQLHFDNAGQRFAARVTDLSGNLSYAVWQPRTHRRLVYSPAVSVLVVPAEATTAEPWTAVMTQDDLSLEELESAFLRWFQNREWTPVLMTSEFRLFASGNRATVSAESTLCGDGLPCLRLTARVDNGKVRGEFVLEADRDTRRPRLSVVRYESAQRSLELRIVPVVAREALTLPFEPPASLMVSGIRDTKNDGPPRTSQFSPLLRTEPAMGRVASRTASGDLEIQALYALHRVGACLAEPIQVVRENGGGLAVTGMASTAERAAELREVLAPLAGMVRIDLHVTGEIFDSLASTASALAPSSPAPPVRAALAAYLSPKGDAARRFAESAIDGSNQLASEAQALRDLALRFPDPDPPLADRSRLLLNTMLRDHADSLIVAVEKQQDLFRRASKAGAVLPAEEEGASLDGRPWQSLMLHLFERASALDADIRTLAVDSTGPRIEARMAEIMRHLQALRSAAYHTAARIPAPTVSRMPREERLPQLKNVEDPTYGKP